jgi:hypothetical protein
LIRDFADEVPGYLHNSSIREALDALELSSGAENIPEAMRTIYGRLVEMGLVGPGELPLLDAWLEDLRAL